MTILFSAATRGFYDPAIHGDLIPADAVVISAEEHTALLVEQSAGRQIVADAEGYPVAIDPSAPDLMGYLATRRWEAEIGGTAWNGWHLATDERSQGKYLAELAAVNEGLRQDGQPWKFPHGFENLTNAQIKEMAAKARDHVLACFVLEAELAGKIADGRIATPAEIDAAFAAL